MIGRTVIIGGSGFIGRWVTAALLGRGAEVVVIDPNPPADPRATWVSGDAADAEGIGRVLKPGDALIHLFHSSIPADSLTGSDGEAPDDDFSFIQLLKMLAKAKPSLFVYSSTGGQIYGHAPGVPLTEACSTQPITGYGRTKLAMEKLIGDHPPEAGIPFIILRISNPYGPYQELTNRHGVVPHLMRSAIHGTTFTAFGAEETVRDYIYIEDTAEAVVRLMESGKFNQTVNIGTGVGTSLAALIALAEKITGKKIKVKHEKIRSCDVTHNVLDTGRLQKLTGFKARVGLEDGLAQTWQYFKEHEKA